jgi:hypothetical protein
MRDTIQTSEYTLTFDGEWDAPHSEIIEHAVASALDGTTKLTDEIFSMVGYSGRYNRIILNTLVEKMPNASYLESGSWTGSTACSALYKNSGKITCIENFEYDGVLGNTSEQILLENIQKYTNENTDFKLINKDFRQVDYSSIGKYNIYLYDGAHDYQDHYDGIILALPAMEDEFILIVDDWNWAQVREGTLAAIKDSGVNVISAIHAITNTVMWNNGYYIAAIKK